jgi:hypothetical protein
MVSCDYNGWTDVPEDEREGLDRYESKAFDRSDELQADLRSAANRAQTVDDFKRTP